MESVTVSAEEKQLLVEVLEAAYRRQKKEASDVIAHGDHRFHQEVADRLCLLGDLLDRVGSSENDATENDPTIALRQRIGLNRDAE